MTSYLCQHIGVSFITDKIIKKYSSNNSEYIIRQGISIFGCLNNVNSIKDPFDDKYMENYIQGKGYTLKAAEKEFTKNLKDTVNSLW